MSGNDERSKSIEAARKALLKYMFGENNTAGAFGPKGSKAVMELFMDNRNGTFGMYRMTTKQANRQIDLLTGGVGTQLKDEIECANVTRKKENEEKRQEAKKKREAGKKKK